MKCNKGFNETLASHQVFAFMQINVKTRFRRNVHRMFKGVSVFPSCLMVL